MLYYKDWECAFWSWIARKSFLPADWPEANYLTSLSLSILICKMGMKNSCNVKRLWCWSKYTILSEPLIIVHFSHSVKSDYLQSHRLQYARLPCPSPTPRAYSNSCPLSQWCHPAISSSVVPFPSCLQSLPASGSFPMSQLFPRGGQSIGVSALAPFLPKKSQGWSPSEWTGWISLQSKGLSRVVSNTTVQSINSSALSLLHSPTLTSIHDHWKNHSLD